MKIRDLIAEGTATLSPTSDSPRLDTELLLSSVLEVDRIYLTINSASEVEPSSLQRFREYLARREKSEPVAYIIGRKEFWGMDFFVGPGVLCPRPETELIVEHGLEFLSSIDGQLSILDLGTGTGCIAVALGTELRKERRDFKIVCLDQSKEALHICSQNIMRYGLGSHLMTLNSNWCEALNESISSTPKSYDLITSNPPYVDEMASEIPKDLSFEPSEALFSGDSGLEDVKILLEQIPARLNPDGLFLCEIGVGHSDLLRSYIAEVRVGGGQASFLQSYDISFIRDLAGIERVFKVAATN